MNRGTLIRLTVVLVGVAALATACGGGGEELTPSATAPTPSTPGGAVATTPTPASGVAGTWNGTYENTNVVGSGTFTIVFTQTGSTLSGTISVQDTPCITEGTITGALDGNQITFGAVKGGTQTIAYEGTLSGDNMSGTYSAGSACANAKGTWEATRG